MTCNCSGGSNCCKNKVTIDIPMEPINTVWVDAKYTTDNNKAYFRPITMEEARLQQDVYGASNQWVIDKKEMVDHPQHYGGKDNPFEAIKIIQHYDLNFCIGSVLKYILRAGKKDEQKIVEDYKKAIKYLELEIADIEKNGKFKSTT